MSKILSNNVYKLITYTCFKQFTRPFIGANQSKVFNSQFDVCMPSIWTIQNRLYSAKKDVAVHKQGPDSEIQTDVKTTIKETTKTVSYTGVILIGIGVTGALFYAIFRELFSSKSPSGVYSQAFKKCSEDTRVQDALGTPIKGHGEESSRGRRRHVRSVNSFCRLIFYN